MTERSAHRRRTKAGTVGGGSFTITLEPRGDGGWRVYSDDLPGLILSHSDRDKVLMDIGPTIKTLLDFPPTPIAAPDGDFT